MTTITDISGNTFNVVITENEDDIPRSTASADVWDWQDQYTTPNRAVAAIRKICSGEAGWQNIKTMWVWQAPKTKRYSPSRTTYVSFENFDTAETPVASGTVTTIDATPSREGYILMLRAIIEGSTNKDDVEWAKLEIVKLGGSK